MYEMKASVIINRPIEDVFAFVADNENDPQWCVPVIDTYRIAGDGPGLQARYSFGADAGWYKPRGEFQIVEFQPPVRVAWRGYSPFSRFEGYYTLEELDEGTRISIHSTFHAKHLYRLIEGSLQKQVAESYERQFRQLKDLLEAENPPAR